MIEQFGWENKILLTEDHDDVRNIVRLANIDLPPNTKN